MADKKELPPKTTADTYESHRFAIDTMTGDVLEHRRQKGDYKSTEEDARREVDKISHKVRRDAGER